jgi:beta-lactamase class A
LGVLGVGGDGIAMQRRGFLAAAALVPAAPALASGGWPPEAVSKAVGRFAELPATVSCLLVADAQAGDWQASHEPDRVMFVGSAVKTFILAQALRDIEAGRFAADAEWTVDDSVRSLVSPVLAHLSGTARATVVLEAMIAHSDNTATDIALAAVTPGRVRALVAEAGLAKTRLPESTRRLFSYIAGAPEGEDLGWEGIGRVQRGASPGPTRPAINEQQTMVSTASEMVRWYDRALAGAYFGKPETLAEFRRIQAMADAIAAVVPPGVKAYAKGGSIDWDNFHCICVAGQMVVGRGTVGFCFTANWTGADEGTPKMRDGIRQAVSDALLGAAGLG